MSDIASTKVNFFGPLRKFWSRRTGKCFGYRTEFEQNNGVRAEFQAEYVIFTSTAFYEQNLSKSTSHRLFVPINRQVHNYY